MKLLRGSTIRALKGEAWEMVRIADAKGMAEGYNRGIQQSRGEILIFSHDDVEILTEELGGRVRGHLEKVDVIGVVGTSRMGHPMWHGMGPPFLYGQIAHPHESGGYEVAIYSSPTRLVSGMEALDGVFMACRRKVVEKGEAFDEKTFEGFHLYDMDFSYSVHRRGFAVGVACDVPMIHRSRGKYDEKWLAAAVKFMGKWPQCTTKEKRKFFMGGAVVESREEVVRRMTPGHWGNAECRMPNVE